MGRKEARQYLLGETDTPEPDSHFRSFAHNEFRAFVSHSTFPCLGAKAAFNANSYKLCTYRQLGGDESSPALASDLKKFLNSERRRTGDYATFIAIFEHPVRVREEEFEERLWSQLTKLN